MIYSLISSQISKNLESCEQDFNIVKLINKEILPGKVLDAIAECSSGWAIDKNLARIIAVSIIEGGRRNILEFGAGTSSLISALALEAVGGGRLTSIEQNPAWCADKWEKIKEITNVDAKLIKSRPEKTWSKLGPIYQFLGAKKAIAERGAYDLVIIDAPQKFLGREGAIPLIYEYLKRGALIVLDDAGRVGEKWAVWQWLKSFPGLQLRYLEAASGKKGVCILEYVENLAPKFKVKVFLAGIMNNQFRKKVYKKDVNSADLEDTSSVSPKEEEKLKLF